MTSTASALRQVSAPELESLRPLFAAVSGRALRLAPCVALAGITGSAASGRPMALRNADLVADLRRARAARFVDRYEWLALRRRRAQIAARHALVDPE